MRWLCALLLLAACGTAPAVSQRSDDAGLNARIGVSGAALYSFTR
jgi:hypothetical protein